MSAFAVFGLCLAIVIVFLIIVGVIMGPQFFMLFIFFPVLISEAITGQRGSFHPNGATRKAPFFEGGLMLSIVLQVLLLSSLLFGIYLLIAGVPSASAVAENNAVRTVLAPSEVYKLLWINTILWLFVVSFAGMFIVNTIRYWKEINLMPKGRVLINYVIPSFMFLAAFFFLYDSRHYLTHYTPENSNLSGIIQAIAIIYGIYLLLLKINEIYMYFTFFRKRQIPLWKGYWFTMSLSIIYIGLFEYFLICLIFPL